MSYPPDDVMQWLGTKCLGLNAGKNMFCGEWGYVDGEEIDAQVLIVDTDVPVFTLKESGQSVGIQIIVRGDRTESASVVYERAKQISDEILNPREPVTMGCACYSDWDELTNIAGLGQDENARHVVSMNFIAHRNR